MSVSHRRAFTLVELIVVLCAIAVVGVLIGAGQSAFAGGRAGSSFMAMRTACLSNQRQLGTGMGLFWRETRRFPSHNYLAPLKRIDDAAVNGPDAWVDPAQTGQIPAPQGPNAPDHAAGHTSGLLRSMSALMIVSGMNDPDLFRCPGQPKGKPFEGALVAGPEDTALIGMDNLTYSMSFGVMNNPPPSLIVLGDRIRYGKAAKLAVGPADGHAKGVFRHIRRDRDEAAGINHAGQGLNTLYGDGHAKWARSFPDEEHTIAPPTRLTVADNYNAHDNILLVTEKPNAGAGNDDTGLY